MKFPALPEDLAAVAALAQYMALWAVVWVYLVRDTLVVVVMAQVDWNLLAEVEAQVALAVTELGMLAA
jgi:hypothetical protein